MAKKEDYSWSRAKRCAYCKSTDVRYAGQKGNFKVFICNRCHRKTVIWKKAKVV